MKFFTPAALLAAFIVSVAVVIPFLPAARKTNDRFALEVTLTSSAAGHLQLYYDRGEGFNESDSSRVLVGRGGEPKPYRLTLPPGIYRNLRFDPLDRDGTLVIVGARIIDRDGREQRAIPLGRFKPLNQIQSLRESDGRLEVVTIPGGNDPQLRMDFEPALTLQAGWQEDAGGWAARAGLVFLALAAAFQGLDRLASLRSGLTSTIRWVLAAPGRAIAIVAAAAVIASAYPVVFLGKSFVSPNYGAVLLYDGFPTLPGYSQDQVSDVKGSDVGATLWQDVPYSMIQHRALFRDGELPLWNRYDSAGSPLLGQGQSMFGDPLQLLVVTSNTWWRNGFLPSGWA
jgi:hypothetical protein